MFTVFLGLGLAAFAQNPGRGTPDQTPNQADPSAQSDSKSATLTGCLMKGDTEDQYALTDNESGEKYSFAAPNQLQRYLNQTVQLTGTVTMQGGAKSFRPESVKSIAASCERQK